LNKKLHPKIEDFLQKLSSTRRMARNMPEELFGVEGEFYVDAGEDLGQDYNNPNVISANEPPKTQPGLWCQWIPTEDGMGLEWDGGEKFYSYTEWIGYIIEKILEPNGYVVNGKVKWQGAEMNDRGIIIVKDNHVDINELE